jgi:hypothetical protein
MSVLFVRRLSTEKFAHATNPVHNLNHWLHDVGIGRGTSFRADNGTSFGTYNDSGVCVDTAGQQIGQRLRQNRFRCRPNHPLSHHKGDGFTGEKRESVQDIGGVATDNRSWQ